MCGFAGIIRFDGRPVEPEVLRRMTFIQRHRGPDDQAFALFDLARARYQAYRELAPGLDGGTFSAGLGFNRLSIQDTSERGRQPMSSDDGQVHLVLNGEIYNAPELRKRLESRGQHFRSSSDTEVMIHWYQTFGWDDLLGNVTGMFAICLIDLREKAAFLARDHVGVKPLYLVNVPGAVLFASEAKSFLPHPDFKFQINSQKLDEYLLFRYVAGTETLIQGVRQLPPGSWVRVSDSIAEPIRFWSWPASEPDPKLGPDDLRQVLEGCVRSQLLSDVKLGCQLSGGVDSGLVNLYAARAAGEQLDAISVILNDPAYSEEPWIDQAAERAGVRVHKCLLEANWFARNLRRASWHLDQPINHPNSLGILFLAENAKSVLTVLLSGEGADELLGGYPRFFYQSLLNRHPGLIAGSSKLPGLGPWLRKKFCLNQSSVADRQIFSTARISSSLAREILPGLDLERALATRRRLFAESAGNSPLQKSLNYEMGTYLQEMLLRQDKMTMAVGIENRVPFLDHHLIEFARRLTDSQLVTSKFFWGKNAVERNTKVALKQLAEREFGSSFAYRKKSGFAFPLKELVCDPEFEMMVEEELLPGLKQRELFETKKLQKIWQCRKQVEGQELELFWIATSFELWASQFSSEASQTMVLNSVD